VSSRRPGWTRRIRDELRFYYGAHLHRRLFWWFGAGIAFAVLQTLLVAHYTRAAPWGGHRPWQALLIFGIPAFVLWSASGRIARRIARPLYELARVAHDIGEGDLSARANLSDAGLDEIAMLSHALNQMAGRIERQLAEQRELLAAVSHELRTPLARIRLLVEIAREGRFEPRTLDEIERETIEIDTLVGELLASARLEFQALVPKPLDACEMARRAIERAGEDPQKLKFDACEVKFAADPTLVARALSNLIDNARKHGDGLEMLRVTPASTCVVFTVTDKGPGFAPGDEARIFGRFYQGASAPAKDGVSRGSLGLGLSLVKRIAEAHGGKVSARNRDHGGAQLCLVLPFQPPVRPARVKQSPSGEPAANGVSAVDPKEEARDPADDLATSSDLGGARSFTRD
jgi:signal transduction histidine kinase